MLHFYKSGAALLCVLPLNGNRYISGVQKLPPAGREWNCIFYKSCCFAKINLCFYLHAWQKYIVALNFQTTIAQYLVVLSCYVWLLVSTLDVFGFFFFFFLSLAHWHLQSFTWILQILHFYPLWAPRALHLWFWWTAQNQRTVEGSHAPNLVFVMNPHQSEAEWIYLTQGRARLLSRPCPWMNPENTWPLVCCWDSHTREYGKLTQYHTFCYSVRKWCFLCLTVKWNETHFGSIHLNFPWHNLLSHFYLNTNVFCLHRTTCCLGLYNTADVQGF